MKIFEAMNCETIDSALLETTEKVPQLLRDAASAVGVKTLRLVCKAASAFALRAVRNFSLKLRPVPSEAEPLLEVAVLLQQTQLRCLRVDFEVERGTILLGIIHIERITIICMLPPFFNCRKQWFTQQVVEC